MTCRFCNQSFEGSRSDQRYCSPGCRRRAEYDARRRKAEIRREAYLNTLSEEERAAFEALAWPVTPGSV